MDELKEGIHLRAYGQKDPLLEYKGEAFRIFEGLIHEMSKEAVSMAFKYYPVVEDRSQRTPQRTSVRRSQRVEVDELGVPIATSMADSAMQFSHPTSSGGTGVNYVPEETEQRSAPRSTVQTQYRDEPKIGRNDPCPCGSGKKYKQCHGKSVV